MLRLKPFALLMACVLALPSLAAERSDIGLSTAGTVIESYTVSGAQRVLPTVVLIGGLEGPGASVAAVERALAEFEQRKPAQRPFRLVAVPLANPQGVPLAFPPTGVAYRENAEAHVLWRWAGLQAPDLVLIASSRDFGLIEALSNTPVAGVGRIPARLASARRPLAGVSLQGTPSEARREMERRLARTPRQLAEELALYYGREFEQPLYIQALALIARARLGQLDDVRRLAEPYVDGTKDSLARPNSLVLAGHLVFTELARRTGDPRYTSLVRKAADLGFDADGGMKPAMPFHDEYSDSVFMGTVIAAQAGALTGERKYFDLAARHVAYMQNIVRRGDGLYRHQPLTDAAWGRGNGFPAIGLALALSEFPKDHPEYPRLLQDFQVHMAVLARHQTADGLWRNVVDHPGAYRELSATAMIGFAMLRGIRSGWLAADVYQPRVDLAWRAVLARVGRDGHVMDACESTTRMKSLQEYLHRTALLGPDPRSGAVVLLLATELAGL